MPQRHRHQPGPSPLQAAARGQALKTGENRDDYRSQPSPGRTTTLGHATANLPMPPPQPGPPPDWPTILKDSRLAPPGWHLREGRMPSNPDLACISVPFTASETDSLLANLSLWRKPKLSPFAAGAERPVDLTLVLDRGPSMRPRDRAELLATVQALVPAYVHVALGIAGLGEQKSINYGDHDQTTEIPWLGRHTGTNLLFIRSMIVHRRYGFLLRYTADCYPVRPNWLGRLQEAFSTTPSFLMGPVYTGDSQLRADFQRHITPFCLPTKPQLIPRLLALHR